MHTESPIEPTGRRKTVPAKLLSVIRGDKYMVDAYPTGAPPASPSPVAPRQEG